MFKCPDTVVPVSVPAGPDKSRESGTASRRIHSACTRCRACLKHCRFLSAHGTPGRLARDYEADSAPGLELAFECSLCGLCTAVCPAGLSPPDMFLEWRRQAVDSGTADLSAYNGILSYEKKGCSSRFSFYSLPAGCTTVFFPGCTLTGTRPEITSATLAYLDKKMPGTGMVLDCCTKPSLDLGRQEFFDAMFFEMTEFLEKHGITTIITACPSCHKVFSDHSPFNVLSVYQILAQDAGPEKPLQTGNRDVVIQDPCQARDNIPTLAAVREIVRQQDLNILPSAFSGKKTLCCGEGGFTGCTAPDMAKSWSEKRVADAKGTPAVTYCAGCVNFMSGKGKSVHVLDLVFDREKALAGKARSARAPFTYLNRLRLKKTLNARPAAVTREREFFHGKNAGNPLPVKRLMAAALVLAAMAGIHLSGLGRSWALYLDPATLAETVDRLGIWAPVVYMLAYTLAPALMLPGLPLSVAGGILFGPFWGVVYTIFGATAGAGMAFLIARYVSAGFLETRLNRPAWQRLYKGVEKNGWKVVVVTRLVPLFPFNLLNYALGLTPIRFSHYMAATFLGMLPACIALVVFSSAIPDLLRGNLSTALILGVALLALTGTAPLVYKKVRARGRIKPPL